MTEKTHEARVRRAAKRRGLILVKSRRRDPGALDYGLYVVVDDSAGNRPPRSPLGGQAAISAFARGEGMTLQQADAEVYSVRSP